jgi:S-adenosyl methyltransferase
MNSLPDWAPDVDLSTASAARTYDYHVPLRRRHPPAHGTRTADSLTVGWELVEPGLIWVPQWHPTWPDEVGEPPEATSLYADVGTKA